MNEIFNGMNGKNRVFRSVNSISIRGMNNTTYIYSSVNSLEVSGSNQRVFCNFTNSRVNSIYIYGINNTIYINRNSNHCIQNVQGVNNRIIFTNIQDDNNIRENPFNNVNHLNNINSASVLGGSYNLINNNQNNNNNNIRNDINNRNNDNIDNHNNLNIINNVNNDDIRERNNQINNKEINRNLPSYDSLNANNKNITLVSDDEFLFEKRYEHDIIDDEECNICNTKFKKTDIIKKMQCGHIFHKFCHDKFKERQVNNANYPMCFICFQWELQDSLYKKDN